MAELVLGVAKSLVEGTLTKAQSAIDDESKLRQSAQRDLVFIAGEFQMMQSFLRVTTKEQVRNNVVSTWVIQVRDLAYDVEDCIEFVIHLDTKSDWWRRMIPPFLRRELPLDVAVNMINQLKARVHDVSQRNKRYKLISEPDPKPVTEARQLAVTGESGVPAAAMDTTWNQQEFEPGRDPLVGRMSEVEQLSAYLAKARVNALQVMSVWGIAGAGKSALVSSFYHNKMSKSKEEYTKYIWVDLYQPFNLIQFCKSVLMQFHQRTLKTDEDPVKQCHGLLKDHQCLVVIDNMQSTEEWDLIHYALAFRPSRSAIIVITSEERIALHCADRKDLVFNIKALESVAAIDLFKEKVKGRQHADAIANDSVLKQLISKSGGLPKVIVAIADYLAPIFNWAERAKILNDQFITTMETWQDFACLRDLFGWMHSYFHSCPDFLKPCIFYLSIFPKSEIIRRRRLVMRWVAEGYSKDKASDSAEENAEQLFAKIVELSMIQPPGRIVIRNRRTVWCQVSAFFHEYIISRPKEENVTFALEVFALKGCCRQTTGRTGRHLVIEQSWERDMIVFKSIDLSRLRSLTVFGDWASFFICESMKALRVLDLENASGVTDKDLRKILKLLLRLKFLSLRGCIKISNLPSSVANLRQLQILDVRHTSILTMPASLTKLKKLQYIRAGTTTPPDDRKCLQLVGVEMASGVKKLTLLHTLGVVNVGVAGGKAILKELRILTQLRKLGVCGISKKNGKEFCSAVTGHSHLESLSVCLDKDNQDCLNVMSAGPPKKLQSLKLYGPVEQLPMWINQLCNLRKLNLEMDILSEDDIRVLGGLQELCILRICVNPVHDFKVKFCVMHNGVEERCYKEIKVLEIASRSKLNLMIGAEAMENLELLKAGCYSSGSLPQFGEVKHLKKLKDVHVIGSHDEEQKKIFKNKFEQHPNNPALILNSSAQASTAGNGERCSFPFTPTSSGSLATHPHAHEY